MKKLLLPLVIFAGCATTQPTVVCPVCPPMTVVHDTVSESRTIFMHDTVTQVRTEIVDSTIFIPTIIPIDTQINTAYINPSGGDDWPAIQNAVNLRYRVRLGPGRFSLSRPILAVSLVGGAYGQSWIDIEGFANAKDAPLGTVITTTFSNTFAIGLQQCKGCRIANICFQGNYNRTRAFNAVTVDTLPFASWGDGICSDNPTSPYAAIVIDPFSDPANFDSVHNKMYSGLEKYYVPGMSRSGSTAVNIIGCGISGFIVGVMVTPSYQLNGEEINLMDSRIDYCKVAYAYSQAQSKANTITNFMCWGGVHTVIDGQNYGFRRGDGATAPMVDVMNIAGNVHQLINAWAGTFPITVSRVYAEGLFKIGAAGGEAGTHFNDLQIDFQNGIPGVPSPDFYYYGPSTTWTSCMLRLYNGNPDQRIVLNSSNNTFIGGSMSNPPICSPTEYIAGYASDQPTFERITAFYSGQIFGGNEYDSLVSMGVQTIHVKSDYTGYILLQTLPAAGDLLTTQTNYQDQFNAVPGACIPVGFVIGTVGDTIKLSNIGVGIADGSRIPITDCKLKMKS